MRFLRSATLCATALLLVSAAAGQDSVNVELDTFGVGNTFRPGNVTAAKVILSNTLSEPTGVWVQWEVPNADGDIAEHGREVVLNAGQDQELWLYAPLPPRTDMRTVWSVRVFEYDDGRRLRELGGARISPASANANSRSISTDLIAVVNEGNMGLDYYGAGLDPRAGRPMNAHEMTATVGRIKPGAGLPDRWYGLSTFQTIVWGNESPSANVGFDQAEALREWIRRGGHLVIALPSAGNPWELGNQLPSHELGDLMPPGTPVLKEDVHFGELLPVLSKSTDPLFHTQGRPVRNEGRLTIRTFPHIEEATADTNWYQPVMRLPDGETIVIQRTYGHGRITVIGIPVADSLLPVLQLPEADVFWNEILGRRVDTPTTEQLNTIDREQGQLIRSNIRELDLGSGALFSEQINMNREAAAGLLLSLFLFVIYWIVAGPGGFAVLKIYKQQHHAWIAFAGAAALFTAIAWMGVAVTKVNTVQIQHVTYLDRIARPGGDRPNDPQVDRAIGWMSVYLPGYGPAEITIESDAAPKDLLHSWETPGVATNPFPNADRYSVDVGRDFATARIPARATSTQLHANWLGNTAAEFGGLFGEGIQLVRQGDREVGLRGRILHDFPVELEDARIILVTNGRIRPLRYARSGEDLLPHVPVNDSGMMRVRGYFWGVRSDFDWTAGTPLNLEQFTDTGLNVRLESEIKRLYVDPETGSGFTGLPGSAQARGLAPPAQRRYMEMLSLFNQLTPPQYVKASENALNPDQVIFYREIGRELDLSPWFAQPCIIVIGYLRNSPCPIPLTVNGRTPEAAAGSVTVVRWVYPLPLDTELMFDNRSWGLGSEEPTE